MSRFFVLPYTGASRSAKTMAEALPEGKRIRLEGSTYRPQAGDVIVNWGKLRAQDHLPRLPDGVKLLNHDTKITDKLAFFTALTRAGNTDIIPRFWTRRQDIPNDAFPVFCRTTGGHAGQGIVIAETRAGLVDAPLYTQYIEQHSEYRVHVGKKDNEVTLIGFQIKLRKNGVTGGETRIKHLQNGYIYGRSSQEAVPGCVLEAAKTAFLVSGLDFGALDILYSSRLGRAFVLEVNTAPDIEGLDIPAYSQFFQSFGTDAPVEEVLQVVEEPVVAAAPAAAPVRAAPAPRVAPAPAARVVAEAVGNRRFAVVMGVSLEAAEVRATVEANSLEEAIRLVRQNPNAYLGAVQPVVDVTGVSLER